MVGWGGVENGGKKKFARTGSHHRHAHDRTTDTRTRARTVIHSRTHTATHGTQRRRRRRRWRRRWWTGRRKWHNAVGQTDESRSFALTFLHRTRARGRPRANIIRPRSGFFFSPPTTTQARSSQSARTRNTMPPPPSPPLLLLLAAAAAAATTRFIDRCCSVDLGRSRTRAPTVRAGPRVRDGAMRCRRSGDACTVLQRPYTLQHCVRPYTRRPVAFGGPPEIESRARRFFFVLLVYFFVSLTRSLFLFRARALALVSISLRRFFFLFSLHPHLSHPRTFPRHGPYARRRRRRRRSTPIFYCVSRHGLFYFFFFFLRHARAFDIGRRPHRRRRFARAHTNTRAQVPALSVCRAKSCAHALYRFPSRRCLCRDGLGARASRTPVHHPPPVRGQDGRRNDISRQTRGNILLCVCVCVCLKFVRPNAC